MPNYMYVPLATNDRDGMLSKEDKKKIDDGGFCTFSVGFDARSLGTVYSGTSEICEALVDMRNAISVAMSCEVQSLFENCSVKFQYSTDLATEDWFDLTDSVGVGDTGFGYTAWVVVPEGAVGTARKVRAAITNSGSETTGEIINLTLLVRSNTHPVPDNWLE